MKPRTRFFSIYFILVPLCLLPLSGHAGYLCKQDIHKGWGETNSAARANWKAQCKYKFGKVNCKIPNADKGSGLTFSTLAAGGIQAAAIPCRQLVLSPNPAPKGPRTPGSLPKP